MAPELRRTRHETFGTGHQESRETRTPTYGTRSSKRKVSEINNPDSSPSGSKTSTQSSQSSLDEVEPMPPPAKRNRKSSLVAPKTPEEEEINPDTLEVPSVIVDAPSTTGTDEDEPIQETPATPKSTRGGFRGRRGGRGRWGWGYRGARGGRGGSGAGPRSTPATESSPSAPKALRGRGGHRVKKSDNARIQALYHRRAALKHQFKQVAFYQKAALISIAEKALEAAKFDPNYHKNFEEFNTTTEALNDVYKNRRKQLMEEYELKEAYLIGLRDKNKEYAGSQYEAAIEEVEERIEAKIMEKVDHIYRQWANSSTVDETPLYRGEVGKVVKRIPRPTPMVHSIATPYNYTFVDIKDPDQFEDLQHHEIKNLLEQHPADHWLSMTKQQQEGFISKMKKAAIGDKGRKIRNTKGSALYQPQAEVLEVPNALPDLISAAPTPAEVSGDDTETDETESNGEEQPTDQYGVKVPKKPIPRNGEIPQNRIVSDMPVVFEEYEIGIRKHVYRKTNKNDQTYLGMDVDPNPKKAHWDQNASGYNSAKNKKEDLDQEMVRAFKLHPMYGMPLPQSVNPDYDECENAPFNAPTNWAEDLSHTEPTVLIEETARTADDLDEDKQVFLTSRSSWILRSKEEWEEIMPRFKMSSVLAGIGALDRPEPRPVVVKKEESVQPEPVPQVINSDLIAAVNEAAELKRLEAIKAATIAPPAPPPPSTRSHGYDPVRDTTYRTPYSPRQPVPAPLPPPPPPPPPPRTEKLTALADLAESRGPIAPAPPQAYHAHRNSWGPPAPRYPPMPQAPPATYFSSFTPVNAPYGSPRAVVPPGPPQGQFRELRPAPPQQPVPQPGRQWYPRPPPYSQER
ncbi:hypothetical protein LHYA1_G002523 [Lachnellula hyalina]|uniref:Uncharacterized protein n=1 Tax=Lachnellula hyalina TaxID=1316788 RepID=A0A8H8R833_9HELO|nr:uncharacterized protein LHYA1_G002523 [Lachnellula hyalina]TVY30085.1 hypothetical protein LHYA1_G002523 [Lachnellula hyalina]